MDRDDGILCVSHLRLEINGNFVTDSGVDSTAGVDAYRVALVPSCTTTDAEEASAPWLLGYATVAPITLCGGTSWGLSAPCGKIVWDGQIIPAGSIRDRSYVCAVHTVNYTGRKGRSGR